MLAIKVAQKDGTFFIASYKAEDILRKVRFQSRYHEDDGERPEVHTGSEEIARFIEHVENRDRSFQRSLKERKLKDIVNFYTNCQSQPLMPVPVLLFTGETLKFDPIGEYSSLGNLVEPEDPYLIIDGQHRLAGLKVFFERNPEEAGSIEVPAIIFDGRQEDFAAEMFVLINSTQTKINKSHLIDLMESTTYSVTPEKRWSAWIVNRLYEDQDSPLWYKINMLGGRSKQEKWIQQSELYNEIYKLVNPDMSRDEDGDLHQYFKEELGFDRKGDSPDLFIDYLTAVKNVFGEDWGDKNNFITSAILIKAYIRILGDLLKDPKLREEYNESPGPEVFAKRIEGWSDLAPELRKEHFYERFAAKGQLERVKKVKDRLSGRMKLKGKK